MRLAEFKNEPLRDFKGNPEHELRMKAAIAEVGEQLGREYDLVIKKERIKTQDKFSSINPSQKDQTVGVVSKADAGLAERAIRAADEAFKTWSHTPVERRAELAVETARIIRERKYHYMAWMCYEVGKTWAEADADVAEAIDFAEFYAREILRLDPPQPLTSVHGERNFLKYLPLGVGVVIPPWNFPLAIATGMTLASVVAGNTVVLKPSSDAPVIAYKLFEALEEAGMPAGVVNYLPGPGGAVGDLLVGHPRTRFVAFTGSKEVGLQVNSVAAKTAPGQIWVKRVIAEMGGKNSIVVDSETDLEAAVEGVTVSAFGYQGQKCSACSRAIVDAKVYDAFLDKLAAKTRNIKIGPADDPANFMGPVISRSARSAIQSYIEVGRKEGRVVVGDQPVAGDGFFISPTVIADIDSRARIFQEEIFGPVLAVSKARDFEHALELANDSEYGLTGAVFSNDPEHLRQATERFHVGNLYLNRKCTGAMVGAHPFGGFNMSGTDSKAGGPDYLLLFLQAKSIAQRV